MQAQQPLSVPVATSKGRKVNYPLMMLFPATAFLILLALFPTGYLLYLSFSRWDVSTLAPVFVGLENFRYMFLQDPSFWEALRRSTLFTVAAVAIEYVLGFGIAVVLNRKLPGLGIIRTLIIVPMAMTPVVVGLVWRLLYDPTFGMVNYLLSLISVPGRAWVAESSTALGALILVDVWQWTPFMFLVMTAGLSSLPTEPYEAAQVDGASSWQVFWRLTFPLLAQVSLLALMVRAIDAWKAFDIIYAVTKGGPGTSTQTLNFYAYMKGFQWFDLGYAAALALIVLIVSLVIANLLMRFAPSLLEVD